jgi:hypothetical protein
MATGRGGNDPAVIAVMAAGAMAVVTAAIGAAVATVAAQAGGRAAFPDNWSGPADCCR